MGYTGPKDQWQAELDKADKASLFSLIETLLFVYVDFDRGQLLRLVRSARKEGKYISWRKRQDSYETDPTAYIDRQIKRLRRQKAAKRKAASKGRTK